MKQRRISKIEYAGKIPTYDIEVLSKNNNHNFILKNGIVSHNSGKSYSALSIGEQLDPNFSIDRVAFTPTEFLNLIERDENLPSGSVIILDEGQLTMSSRDWYSVQNKLINQVLSTFRYKQLIVIFTTPDLSYLDSQARKLFHMYLETLNINHKKCLATLKPFWIINVRRQGQIFYKYPVVNTEHGAVRLTRVRIKKPSRKLCTQYENKKRSFTKELYLQFKATLSGNKDPDSLGKSIMSEGERKYYLYRKGRPEMKDAEIAIYMEKKLSYVKKLKQTCKEKGWLDKDGNCIEKEGVGI